MSIDGDLALVGASRELALGVQSGAAYVFRREAGAWVEMQRLEPADAAPSQGFGDGVSLSGGRALIGAYGDAHAGFASGAVYVFELTGGIWVETAKLTAGDPHAEYRFGFSVALDGDRAVVGTPGPPNDLTSEHGAAYAFELTSGVWEQTKLVASDGEGADRFGNCVAISGDLLVVTGDSHHDQGAAWVYERTLSGWTEKQKLMASDTQSVATFGQALDITADRILVGDRNRYDGLAGHVGAAFLFERPGEEWAQIAKLTASDASSSGFFGQSVGLLGTTALVGAQRSISVSRGAVYVTELEAGRSLRYCTSTPNSTGLPALIDATGSFAITANDTTLHASQAPPLKFGQFFYGAAPVQFPFADGYLCVSPFDPGLFRLFPLVRIQTVGTGSLPLDLTSLAGNGEILAWSSWYFQFWFRDPAGGASGSNLSDGLRLGFCP